MSRSKLYQVKDNRIRFQCKACGNTRSLSVPPRVRTRSVRCYKCSTLSRCSLNRRSQPRSQQTGKVSMFLPGGRTITVDIHDISLGGLGITVPPGKGRIIRLGDMVHFKCGWNPRLFANTRYIVKSINGSKIGIQNSALKPWY